MKKLLITFLLILSLGGSAFGQTRPHYKQIVDAPIVYPEQEGISYLASDAAANATKISALLLKHRAIRFVCAYPIPVSSPVIIQSNSYVSGLSLKGTSTSQYLMASPNYTVSDASVLENVTITDCVFDGTDSYPTVEINPNSIPQATIGIYLRGSSNVKIMDSLFKNLSAGGIFSSTQTADSPGTNGLSVSNNTFVNSQYSGKVVAVYGLLSTENSKNNTVTDNNISTNSINNILDASDRQYTSSKDGIHFDQVLQSRVARNFVNGAPGIGIRIEECRDILVSENTVSESGADGIMVYNDNYRVQVVNNTVRNWGRLPLVSSARLYDGDYYYATVFPTVSGYTLPADPSDGSAFFMATWPYSLENVNTSTILPYDNTAYYDVSDPATLLPFRGYSGISLNQSCFYSTAENNTVIGSSSVDALSKPRYANDYGISVTHHVNTAGGVAVGDGRAIRNNQIFNVSRSAVFTPPWIDGSITTLRNGTVPPVYRKNNFYNGTLVGASPEFQEVLYVHETDSSFMFSSISSAFEFAVTLDYLRNRPFSNKAPIRVYVRSNISEPVDLTPYTTGLGHIELYTAATITVTLDPSEDFLTLAPYSTGPNIFGVFDMGGSGRYGITLNRGASVYVAPLKGVINAGEKGLLLSGGSRASAVGANFSGAGVVDVEIQTGSLVSWKNGIGTGSTAINTLSEHGAIFK